MMKLIKLIIIVEKSFPIMVMFNPNQITIEGTGWRSNEDTGLAAADSPQKLSMDLFFDTSLPLPGIPTVVGAPGTLLLSQSPPLLNSALRDVRNYTKRICDLTQPRGDLGRPPICELMWGNPLRTFFKGVLMSVTQTFTRFLEDGTPVRVTLRCSFEEWESPLSTEKLKNLIDDPVRVVKQGETLTSIAAEEYGDATRWRVIADANRGLIQNPGRLAPGTVLTVPPLRPASEARGDRHG